MNPRKISMQSAINACRVLVNLSSKKLSSLRWNRVLPIVWIRISLHFFSHSWIARLQWLFSSSLRNFCQMHWAHSGIDAAQIYQLIFLLESISGVSSFWCYFTHRGKKYASCISIKKVIYFILNSRGKFLCIELYHEYQIKKRNEIQIWNRKSAKFF